MLYVEMDFGQQTSGVSALLQYSVDVIHILCMCWQLVTCQSTQSLVVAGKVQLGYNGVDQSGYPLLHEPGTT